MKQWSIGLAGWVLTDGNYADFEVETVREFALEFYLIGFAKSSHSLRSAELLERSCYRVNAVSYIDSELGPSLSIRTGRFI